MADDLDDAIRELRTAPPPTFVALRNRIAKDLRAAKRKDEATAIAALRRPGWADWALNATALDQPGAVTSFLVAARALQRAQTAAIEGRDGPDLRECLQGLRTATGGLARQAGEVLRGAARAPDTAELTHRLAEVAGHPAALAQLEAATLGTSDPGDEDGLGTLLGLSSGASAARAQPAPARRPKPEVVRDVEASEDNQAAAEARAAQRRAQRAAAVEVARRELDDARRAVTDAEAQLVDSTVAVAAADEALRSTRDQHATVERRHRQATRTATDAERRLAKTQRALDALGE